jgi:hypothetical protein
MISMALLPSASYTARELFKLPKSQPEVGVAAISIRAAIMLA